MHPVKKGGITLGVVFRALNADAVMIIEAPDQSGTRSTVAALQNFAAHFGLRARSALIGFASHTRQEIALLYDPDIMTAAHAPMGDASLDSAAPRFDYSYAYDLDGDNISENIGFSKPPLEAELRLRTGLQTGAMLRLIGVHVKSKAAHHARGDADYIRIATHNRRKQLAECFWLRGRVAQILANDAPLIVLGDFNDGPGLDEYEQLFGHSSVEVVMGAASPQQPQLICPAAAKDAKLADGFAPTSARFYLDTKNDYFEALLDFIMISPNLAPCAPMWRIWHPLRDAQVMQDPVLADALLTASDHFPVTLDINPPQPKALP
jgi:endonuclease/exonuclease/phosphatase family metal-dependent hydrolase